MWEIPVRIPWVPFVKVPESRMTVSRAISQLRPVGTELKIVLDGLCSPSLRVLAFDFGLILLEIGAPGSELRTLSRTALLDKYSSRARRL